MKNTNSFFVRAYMRASTEEQDANRARIVIDDFASSQNIIICNYYVENESGAQLERPELFRLLRDCRAGDILLIEDIDRLSRLEANEWEKLKAIIKKQEVKIVAVNVPTTWMHLTSTQNDFDARIFSAINDMLIDMLAAIARRDYEKRIERQKQGIAKAKSAGLYKGRRTDLERHAAINKLLDAKNSWSAIQKIMECSRSTIAKAKKNRV